VAVAARGQRNRVPTGVGGWWQWPRADLSRSGAARGSQERWSVSPSAQQAGSRCSVGELVKRGYDAVEMSEYRLALRGPDTAPRLGGEHAAAHFVRAAARGVEPSF
jgi:hypothetical protein